MLKRDASNPARVRQGLDVIVRNAQAQSRLVADLLDVSRIISGKLRLSLKRTAVSAIICAAADVVRAAADAKGVRMVLDLDRSRSGRARGQTPTKLAAGRLEPAHQRGALHASQGEDLPSPLTGPPPASVSSSRTPASASLRSTSLTSSSGSARSIARRPARTPASGSAWPSCATWWESARAATSSVSSEGPGLGTTFSLRLPIRPVWIEEGEQPEKRKAEPDAPSGPSSGRLLGVRVLVVDDDLDSLGAAPGWCWKGAGASVTTSSWCTPGSRAPSAFDVVISDIDVAEMDKVRLPP